MGWVLGCEPTSRALRNLNSQKAGENDMEEIERLSTDVRPST